MQTFMPWGKMTDDKAPPPQHGLLALGSGKFFQLQVCRSQAGYYIGTLNEEGLPYTRESQEYWTKREQAKAALTTASWTQKWSL